MPMPSAASTAVRSTWRTATKVLVRIGGRPRIASAIATLRSPMPMTAASRKHHRDLWHRAPRVPEADREELPPAEVAEHEPSRQRDAIAPANADRAHLELRAREVPHVLRPADLDAAPGDGFALMKDEVECADEGMKEAEGEHHHVLAFRHGVAKR